jgi:predicted GNAT family N-acyltransferase
MSLRVEFFDAADPRMRAALALRSRVFCDEQGVPPEEEIDAHDRPGAAAVHAIAFDGDEAIGAGRFYMLNPQTVQIGRMAIAAALRGRGAGAALLAALGAEALRRGYERAHLHAQMHARGFYLRAGYRDDGDPLWEAGILHQPMSKSLA